MATSYLNPRSGYHFWWCSSSGLAVTLTQSAITGSDNKITDEEVMALVSRNLPEKLHGLLSFAQTTGMEWKKLRRQLRDYERRFDSSEGKDAFSPALVASQTAPKTGTKKDRWCDFCEMSSHHTKYCRNMKRARELFREQRRRQPGQGDGHAAFFGPNLSASSSQAAASSATSLSPATSFIVDTGASQHICGDINMFVGPMKFCDVNITMVNGKSVHISKYGTVAAIVNTESGGTFKIVVNNTLFLPGKINLLSNKRISEAGHRLLTGPRPIDNIIKLQDAVTNLPLEVDERGLLHLVMFRDPQVQYIEETETALSAVDAMTLHKRLGHLNAADMKKLQKIGNIEFTGKLGTCETCLEAKSKRSPVAKHADRRSTEPGELIHTDLNGPMSVPSISGQRYVIEFVDDATRHVTLYLMKTKAESINKFRDYILDMKALNIQIGEGSTLQADNDSVFRDSKFADFAKQNGIKMRFSPPHTQAQNGVAEREWNTLLDMATAMLNDAGLEKKFWGAAVLHSAFIRNICPASAVSSSTTPFEMIHGRKFDASMLRKFGATAFVHIEKPSRKKFDNKARRGIYLGHALHNRTHLIFIPDTHRIVESIHVKFNENPEDQGELSASKVITITTPQQSITPALSINDPDSDGQSDASSSTTTGANDDDDDDEESGEEPGSTSTTCNDDEFDEDDDEDDEDSDADSEISFKPKPTPKPKLEDDPLLTNFSDLSAESDTGFAALLPDPKTFRQALESPVADKWMEAMHQEIASLEANNTWSLIDKFDVPRSHRILQSKFIFKTKLDESGSIARYKARLVALGNLQREGIDYNDVFAPVAHLTTIRLLLAVAAKYKTRPKASDAVTAFVQSNKLKEKVYIAPPQGMSLPDNSVLLLNKPIYGLKQAPREWNNTIHTWLVEDFGFKPSQADPCLYVYRDGDDLIILIIWVDDMVYVTSNEAIEAKFIDALNGRFKMKHLGVATYVLGIRIQYQSDGSISIDQEKYINETLARFEMTNCKPASTPLEPHSILRRYNEQLDKEVISGGRRDLSPEAAHNYREIVGVLIYLVSCTRPELANSVSQLSQCMSHPLHEHLVAAKHVLRYLRGTSDLAITYSSDDLDVSENNIIKGYADASYGSIPDTRRSVTGYVFFLNNAAVSWKTRVQPTVAISTAEAEYMALCAAAQEAMFLRNILNDMGFPQPPTVIYEDNQPAIHIAENRVTSQRSKHIDIKYHFIREAIINKIIKIVYIPTHDQVADILTKILKTEPTTRHRAKLLGIRGSSR